MFLLKEKTQRKSETEEIWRWKEAMQLHFVLFYFFVCVSQKTFLFPKKSDRLQVVIVFSTSTFWNLWDEFNPETHFALGLNCMFFLLPEFFCFIATFKVFALTWTTHKHTTLNDLLLYVCTPIPGANNGKKKIILSKFQESLHSSWKRLQSDVAVVVLSCCVIYFSDAGGRPCLQRDFKSLKKEKV